MWIQGLNLHPQVHKEIYNEYILNYVEKFQKQQEESLLTLHFYVFIYRKPFFRND